VRLLAAVALIGALGAAEVFAQESSGPVKVIDGDSIKQGGVEMRLHGVDAVEGDQTCLRPNGASWLCGRQAKRELAKLVAGQTVTCTHHGKDSYGRTLATCSVAGRNINDWLVRQGWAVAYTRYSREYVEAQAEAKAARRNIWSGKFTNPERYRNRNRN
jgi:endonuclease YncB( thermonuclease family)